MAVEIHSLPKSERSDVIKSVFVEVFNRKPNFFVRVPGRVNLIGEHIDYCGYGVCPMALEQDIFLAVGTECGHNKLSLHNVDVKFEDFECNLDDVKITLDGSAPKWYQYFLCGVKGILEKLQEDQRENIKGLEVVVSGTIPQSAGLSSSSALVSAAALAAAHAFELKLTKEQLANLCASCERYIGTQGGGMDQAIAFLAKDGCAKLIEFEPLRSTDVQLPQGAVFVIAHSLTNLNKAATGDFNCRVVECRLAAQNYEQGFGKGTAHLYLQLGVGKQGLLQMEGGTYREGNWDHSNSIIANKSGLDWTKIKRLGDLQKSLALNLDEMITLTRKSLKETPYSKQDVIQELNTTSSLVDSVSLTPNTLDIGTFKLYQRALHVFNEAKRVQHFYNACKNNAGGEDTLVTLGNLMRQSHESLRDLYECSHPQLDRIVELAKNFTLGTRLTGAGWGGCTVSLISPDNVEKFVSFLIEHFYKPLGINDGYESIIFTTSPKGGGCVYV